MATTPDRSKGGRFMARVNVLARASRSASVLPGMEARIGATRERVVADGC